MVQVALLGACSSSVQTGDARSDESVDAAIDGAETTVGDATLDSPVQCGAATCQAGQVCCVRTGACYDPRCLACCMDLVDVVEIVTPVPCTSASQCATGQVCVFETAGCSVIGTCRVDFACGRPSQPYCGCDGVTFWDVWAGPPARWVALGACPDAGVIDGSVVDSGGGACDGGTCPGGLYCCAGGCVNLANDPLNCGTCGRTCAGSTPMCQSGTCAADACTPPCALGSVCCEVNRGGPLGAPSCYQGTTCPVGCPLCL